MGYFIITSKHHDGFAMYDYGFKLGKAEERNTQPCRDLPQGIRGTKQAHRLAAQR